MFIPKIVYWLALAVLSWSDGPPLPQGVDHHATFVTSGAQGAVLHVVGGNDYAKQYATHWWTRLNADGSATEWRAGSSLPAPLLGQGVVVTADHVIMTGGQTAGRKNIGDVWTARVRPDGTLDTWQIAPALPAPRFHGATAVSGDHVFVFGGLETNQSTSSVYRARFSNNALSDWTTLDSLPHARSHHAALVHNGAMYLVGGQNGNPAGATTPLRDVIRAVIRADGTLSEWKTVSVMDSAFATHAAFVHGNYMYVAGGVVNNRSFTDMVQRAPIASNGDVGAWEQVAALPARRGHVHQMPVVRDVVYSVGGSQNRQVIARLFIGRLR